MMATEVIFKDNLYTKSPYSTLTIEDCLALHRCRMGDIHTGRFGTYVARKITINAHEWFFLFIDVDGSSNCSGDKKIESAIFYVQLILGVLKKLGALKYFKVLTTGNTGFRIYSSLLLDYESYQAFVEFVKNDLGILDIQPTKELNKPHQLFAYKGVKEHNPKGPENLPHRHSAHVSCDRFQNGDMTPAFYKDVSAGHPDPDEVIEDLERFFNFQQVADVTTLGLFGQRLNEIKEITISGRLKPFSLVNQNVRKGSSMSIDALSDLLNEKGMQHNLVDKKGVKKINFKGRRCPACGQPHHNALVYGDKHYLFCHSTNCPAHFGNKGLPLNTWLGGDITSAPVPRVPAPWDKSKEQTIITLGEIPSLIAEALACNDDVLFRMTAGAGKSHGVISNLVNNIGDKIIIYSCFNVKLQKEAYEKAKEMAPDANIFLWESHNAHCCHKKELDKITKNGYSPSELKCQKCKEKSSCGYYQQRSNPTSGIYFVTHHMLQYLGRIIKPHLLIIDENVIDGFRVRETATESDIESILNCVALNDGDRLLIQEMLKMIHAMYLSVSKDLWPYGLLFNAQKMTDDSTDEDTILSLLVKQTQKTEGQLQGIIHGIIDKISKSSKSKLYKQGVNYKGVNWLKGLVSRDLVSFVTISFDPKKTITFETKQLTLLPFGNIPIKVLDATGDKDVIKKLLGRNVREIRADVPWNAKLAHLNKSIDRRNTAMIDNKALARDLEPCLAVISSPKVLILTYGDLCEQIEEVCKELAPNKVFYTHKFHGPRGINDYEKVDAVLVYGLPYANLTDVFHDAYILFPNEDQEGHRYAWNEIFMNTELTQGIHRIRPVRKTMTEIVVVSSQWPSCLSEPNVIINQPRQGNVTEMAIQVLEPIVKEFGFLNYDIASLAGIVLTRGPKEIKNHAMFRENMKQIIWFLDQVRCYETKDQSSSRSCFTSNLSSLKDYKSELTKLFGVMFGLYITNTMDNTEQNIFTQKLRKVINKEGYKLNELIKVSTQNIWPDLIQHFKVKFPAMEEFGIILPHSQSKAVTGIGYQSDVLNFYDNLNYLGMFGKKKVDLESYTSKSLPQVILAPIPTGYFVINFDKSDIIQVGHGSSLDSFSKSNPNCLITLLTTHSGTVITNNGKDLAKILIQSGVEGIDIHDVILREVITTNGQGISSNPSLKTLFERYGFTIKVDNRTLLSQMFDIWDQQNQIINRDGLEVTVQHRSQSLWLMADLELKGPMVDFEGLYNYWDQLSDSDQVKKQAVTLFKATSKDDRYMSIINNHMSLTGRIYSGLQNTNKEHLRRFIVAAPGCKLISADYSQLEPRILAYRANDQKAVEIFKSGGDIYEIFASMIKQQVPLAPSLNSRDIAKGIIIGCNNGKSEYGVQSDLQEQGITLGLNEIRQIIDLYYVEFPDMVSYQEREVANAISRGYAVSPLGMRRYLKDGESGKLENKVKIFLTQGAASEGFVIAINKIRHEIKSQNLKARIIGIIHDEVLVEADDSVAERVLKIVTTSMESAFEDIFVDMPFPVEADICKYWGEDVKNQKTQAPLVPISLLTINQCYDCDEWVEGGEGWDCDLCRCEGNPIPIYDGMPTPDLCVMI
jgi:hypothetical protein